MADAILPDVESSGIYQIRNLVNGKRYIGSAKCFRVRWNSHRANLRRGAHHSRHLQSSWNRHGEDSFVFEIVELCAPDSLLEREQCWLDTESPEFNVCPTAGNTLGRRFTEETKGKIRDKAVGRKPWVRTEEHRKRQSLARKGKKNPEHVMAALQAGRAKRVWTDEQRAAAAEATRDRYESGQFSRARPVEYRIKIAESLRGRTLPDEVKKKISAAQKGKKRGPYGPMSLEHRKAACSLSDGDVLKIIHLRVSGISQQQIAAMIGISRQQVQQICSRKRYEWVAPEIVIPTFRRNPWESEGFKSRMKNTHKARWARKKESKDAA